jgi:hypothetical protein
MDPVRKVEAMRRGWTEHRGAATLDTIEVTLRHHDD